MRPTLFALGLACALPALALSMRLAYLQWVVHPEYTSRLLLLTYWQEHVGAGVLGMAAIVCFERAFSRKGGTIDDDSPS